MAGSAEEEEEEVEKSTECAGQAGWAGVLVERTPWTLSPEQDMSLSQGAVEKSPPSAPGVPAGWGARDVGGVRW